MTIPSFKARTALATEIARVDRQRFNEAIAQDFYPCAPSTVRGATRVFNVNDIVTLWVYGRLLEEGVVPRKAGIAACGLRSLLSEHPEATRVVYAINSHGSSVWLRREDLAAEHNTLGGASIVSVKEWFLEFPRMRVIHELQEEAATLGAADDE